MKNDYLKELGYLGVTARLKRLSDSFSAGIKELYISAGVDIEPSWHLLLLYLKKNGKSTLTEISGAFKFSQPAANKMISRMAQKGYIVITTDKKDSRKKILRLSQKAVKNMDKFEKIWQAGQDSVKEMLKLNSQFLISLERFELQNELKSFADRAKEKVKK